MNIFGFDIGWDDVKDTVKDVFSPKNIIDAVGTFGGISAKSDAAQTQADQVKAEMQNKIDLSNLDYQHQVELLKLKASLGGGGGGGGSGTDMRPYLYQGKLAAVRDSMGARNDAANLTVGAYKNLIEGATRPLIK